MLHNIIRVTGSALAAAVLTSAALVTCSPTAVAADRSCGLEFTRGGPVAKKPTIVVEVLVDCVVAPASHTMTLALQRRETDGSWVTQAARETKAIPDPRLTFSVSAECRSGVWRGLVDISGSLASNDFTFTDWSGTTLVSASDC